MLSTVYIYGLSLKSCPWAQTTKVLLGQWLVLVNICVLGCPVAWLNHIEMLGLDRQQSLRYI